MKTKEELNKGTARISDEEIEIVTGGLDDLDKRELTQVNGGESSVLDKTLSAGKKLGYSGNTPTILYDTANR